MSTIAPVQSKVCCITYIDTFIAKMKYIIKCALPVKMFSDNLSYWL